MKFNETTVRILVRKNYGECFDFYTQKMGLIPVWGDRNGPYTSFAVSSDTPPCFAIFLGDAMPMFQGYKQPDGDTPTDTLVAVIPQFIEEWGMRCTYFRDPEGNLFELNDASGV